jgi:hypothetical protein
MDGGPDGHAYAAHHGWGDEHANAMDGGPSQHQQWPPVDVNPKAPTRTPRRKQLPHSSDSGGGVGGSSSSSGSSGRGAADGGGGAGHAAHIPCQPSEARAHARASRGYPLLASSAPDTHPHPNGSKESSSSIHGLELDEDSFREELKRVHGWDIVSMRGDGACLFRAVAHHVTGDQDLHAMIRERTCRSFASWSVSSSASSGICCPCAPTSLEYNPQGGQQACPCAPTSLEYSPQGGQQECPCAPTTLEYSRVILYCVSSFTMLSALHPPPPHRTHTPTRPPVQKERWTT